MRGGSSEFVATLAKVGGQRVATGKDFDSKGNLESNTVRLLGEKDARIRPGMTATARIAADKLADVTLVPAEAIFQKDGRPIVYRLHGAKFDEQIIDIVRHRPQLS